MPDLLAYLASPYSHASGKVRNQRFEDACMAAAVLMSQGTLVFSPIAHTHPIAEYGDLETHWEFWSRYDHAMMDRCDRMIVLKLPGWKESKGVQAEIAYMLASGKPVEYMDWD